MGASHSKPATRYTSQRHDWDREGGYIPYRHQAGRRRGWRGEERVAVLEDRRAREVAHAQASRARKDARNKRYEPVNERKAEFRRQYDEHMARKRN